MQPNRSLSRVATLLTSRTAQTALVIGAAALTVGSLFALNSSSPPAAATPTASPSPTPTSRPTATPRPTIRTTPTPTPTPTPQPSPSPVARCAFDGLPLGDGLEETVPILVSIDNHPHARPATGLSEAEMVVENPVQGNTTRFVALFACDSAVATVGPVRSGRWIQVDLWRQLRVLPVIFGAAGYTTAYFAAHEMAYVDGNVEPWPFFSRSSSRPAPYNVYLDMRLLRAMIASDGRLAERVQIAGEARPMFEFDEDWTAPETARSVNTLTIRTASFWSFGWQYDDASNLYQRLDNGSITDDALTGTPLTRHTVVVQRAVSERTFADARADADPPFQHLVGSGEGTVYVDGLAIDVSWARPAEDDVTKWTVAETGEPLVLPPGPIWLEIVPVNASVTEG